MSAERVPGRVRLARALRAAGSGGVHTLTVREQLRCGNPSERVEDLRRRGFEITSTVETRHGCHGARYVMVRDVGDSKAWLTDSALDLGSDSGHRPPGIPPAGVASDVEQMCWMRDYDTDPFGDWHWMPLSEALETRTPVAA